MIIDKPIQAKEILGQVGHQVTSWGFNFILAYCVGVFSAAPTSSTVVVPFQVVFIKMWHFWNSRILPGSCMGWNPRVYRGKLHGQRTTFDTAF